MRDLPPPSKNRLALWRTAEGCPILVKTPGAAGADGILREGAVLQALGPQAARGSCPLHLPGVFAFDPSRPILALLQVEGAETLHAHHQRTGHCSPATARSVGRALGWLHRAGRRAPGLSLAPAGVPRDRDFVEFFTHLGPEAYSRLSGAGIALVVAVQQDRGAMEALVALGRASPADGPRLLHGDLKPANILRVPGHPVRLILVDWERSVRGDPARDPGALLGEYLPVALAPETGQRPLPPDRLRAFMAELLAAYRAQRTPADPPGPDFGLRVLRWAGVALLHHVFGLTHYEWDFGDRARHLAARAADLLARPEKWWGSRFERP